MSVCEKRKCRRAGIACCSRHAREAEGLQRTSLREQMWSTGEDWRGGAEAGAASGFLSEGSCLPGALGPCLLACRWAVGVFGAGLLVPLAGQLVPVAEAIVSVARGVVEFCVLAGVEAGCPSRRLGVLVAAGGWRGARHRHRPGVVCVGGRELSLGIGAEGAVGTC